jgi:hypothetical protein
MMVHAGPYPGLTKGSYRVLLSLKAETIVSHE